jgi:glycosyltransferase involved in cell wall biosynthesis
VDAVIVAFDLHNIRDGGGVNYVRNLLENAEPELDGFDEVHLIGAPRLLAGYPDRPWIVKHAFAVLDRGLLSRLRFMRRHLVPLLRRIGCDVLYVPGGLLVSRFRPVVAISRNMMPFRPEFWAMYPRFSGDWLRLQLLRRLNAWSFASADGMIFLSQTAREVIGRFLGRPLRRVAVIAHGVDQNRFRPLRPRTAPAAGETIRLVYPSRFEPYKHQVEVVQAIEMLADRLPGLKVRLCGPANPSYFAAFEAALEAAPRAKSMIEYLGEVPNAALPELYADSDLLLFASSCENLPNILIEAMASGIPICSSDRSPMPEVCRDACVYFDPSDPRSIADAVLRATGDWDATLGRADEAREYAAAYSWAKTARETFAFIVGTARRNDNGN